MSCTLLWILGAVAILIGARIALVAIHKVLFIAAVICFVISLVDWHVQWHTAAMLLLAAIYLKGRP
jgi:hypothetical protein